MKNGCIIAAGIVLYFFVAHYSLFEISSDIVHLIV